MRQYARIINVTHSKRLPLASATCSSSRKTFSSNVWEERESYHCSQQKKELLGAGAELHAKPILTMTCPQHCPHDRIWSISLFPQLLCLEQAANSHVTKEPNT